MIVGRTSECDRQAHEEWVARRKKPAEAEIAEAIEILRRPTGIEPEEWDRLPEGYVSVRERYSGTQGKA